MRAVTKILLSFLLSFIISTLISGYILIEKISNLEGYGSLLYIMNAVPLFLLILLCSGVISSGISLIYSIVLGILYWKKGYPNHDKISVSYAVLIGSILLCFMVVCVVFGGFPFEFLMTDGLIK